MKIQFSFDIPYIPSCRPIAYSLLFHDILYTAIYAIPGSIHVFSQGTLIGIYNVLSIPYDLCLFVLPNGIGLNVIFSNETIEQFIFQPEFNSSSYLYRCISSNKPIVLNFSDIQNQSVLKNPSSNTLDIYNTNDTKDFIVSTPCYLPLSQIHSQPHNSSCFFLCLKPKSNIHFILNKKENDYPFEDVNFVINTSMCTSRNYCSQLFCEVLFSDIMNINKKKVKSTFNIQDNILFYFRSDEKGKVFLSIKKNDQNTEYEFIDIREKIQNIIYISNKDLYNDDDFMLIEAILFITISCNVVLMSIKYPSSLLQSKNIMKNININSINQRLQSKLPCFHINRFSLYTECLSNLSINASLAINYGRIIILCEGLVFLWYVFCDKLSNFSTDFFEIPTTRIIYPSDIFLKTLIYRLPLSFNIINLSPILGISDSCALLCMLPSFHTANLLIITISNDISSYYQLYCPSFEGDPTNNITFYLSRISQSSVFLQSKNQNSQINNIHYHNTKLSCINAVLNLIESNPSDLISIKPIVHSYFPYIQQPNIFFKVKICNKSIYSQIYASLSIQLNVYVSNLIEKCDLPLASFSRVLPDKLDSNAWWNVGTFTVDLTNYTFSELRIEIILFFSTNLSVKEDNNIIKLCHLICNFDIFDFYRYKITSQRQIVSLKCLNLVSDKNNLSNELNITSTSYSRFSTQVQSLYLFEFFRTFCSKLLFHKFTENNLNILPTFIGNDASLYMVLVDEVEQPVSTLQITFNIAIENNDTNHSHDCNLLPKNKEFRILLRARSNSLMKILRITIEKKIAECHKVIMMKNSY